MAVAVILNDCQWRHTEIAQLQLLPKDGKPVKSWRQRDSAWKIVADAVRQAAEDIRNEALR